MRVCGAPLRAPIRGHGFGHFRRVWLNHAGLQGIRDLAQPCGFAEQGALSGPENRSEDVFGAKSGTQKGGRPKAAPWEPSTGARTCSFWGRRLVLVQYLPLFLGAKGADWT